MKIHADWLGILGADGFETGKKIKCIQIRLSPAKILGMVARNPQPFLAPRHQKMHTSRVTVQLTADLKKPS